MLGRMQMDARDWRPIPDDVALALGRVVFYAAHVDAAFSNAILARSPNATMLSSSVPQWAESGDQLVKALRAIRPHDDAIDEMADRLKELNEIRNQLVHGAWLIGDVGNVTMRRLRSKTGTRRSILQSHTLAELEELVDRYKELGRRVDELNLTFIPPAGS